MGSPTALGAGFERTTDKLAATDDTLRAERQKALEDIFGERETGLERKATGRKSIYDLTKSSQESIDTADLAIDKMEETIAKATAERGRRGQEAAMRGYVDLFKAKAQQIGAWNSTMAQVDGQIRTAMMERDNQLAKSGNWEGIMNSLADIGGSSMMENPEFAELFKNISDFAMMAKLGQIEDEAIALDQGTASTGITSSSVQNRGPGGARVSSSSGSRGS